MGRDGFKRCERSDWKDVNSMSLEALGARQDSAARTAEANKLRTDDQGRPSRKRTRDERESSGRSKKTRRNQEELWWECV